MKRREFITVLGAAAAWPLRARAQQERVRRIGVLMGRNATDPEGQRQAAALERGLHDLGWSLSHNVEITYRWYSGSTGGAQTLAQELIDFHPDLLVANGTPSLAALRDATRTIPIVFAGVADPVAQGFAQSLARPGGNITGFGLEEPGMGGKWVELMREVAPRTASIATIFNPATAPYVELFLPSMKAAGASASVELVVSPVGDDVEIERAFAAAGRRTPAGMIVVPDVFLIGRRDKIIALAAEQRVPTIYGIPVFARSGGLISYGIDRTALFRSAATYIDRIFKGARPAELPVQQPTKFELVINLKTARVLGLEVPLTLLAGANEVIE
jgi:putative ABC transport system substrate-binding protein